MQMVKKPKFGKIFIVVFLTVLIWVWADLAMDDSLPLRSFVTISVSRSSDPTFWVTFVEGPEGTLRSSVTLDSVQLTGPASRVADVRRMQNEGDLELDLFLLPEQEGMTESGTRTFGVLNFLKQNDEIAQLGLTVESCEPRNLTVQVRQLVSKSLQVECFGQNGNPIRDAVIEPPRVSGAVPADVTYTARVQLSEAEQRQARSESVQKTPYVELAPGQPRQLGTPVRVTLPRQEVVLTPYPVQANLGFCFSPILQGQYRVVLDPNQVGIELPTVTINATPAALDAYKQQDFMIFLYILDEDRQATDWIARPVEFNFPEPFVRNGQIEEGENPPVARFRLEPLSEALQESP